MVNNVLEFYYLSFKGHCLTTLLKFQNYTYLRIFSHDNSSEDM